MRRFADVALYKCLSNHSRKGLTVSGSMILPENRFTPRIKRGTGFFRIMLQV